MDNDITNIVAEAIANADRAAADYERGQAERRQRPNNSDGLVFKDFPPDLQPVPAPAPPPAMPRVWRTAISIALSDIRYKLRQEQQDAVAELMSRITALETDVAMIRDAFEGDISALEARLEAIEGEGDVGDVKYLDANLHRTDVGKARFVKIERILKIHRGGKRRAP
jgi:hypothetical protein